MCVNLSFLFAVTIMVLSVTFQQADAQTRVIDGDTIEHEGIVYRLHGIDAPEAGQKCANTKGGTWACGKAAIAAMDNMVSNSDIECDNRGNDNYGRTISVCLANGKDINASLVRDGMAWAFTKFSNDYADVEQIARSKSKGIWQAPTQTASEFRAEKWNVGKQKAPDGCPIKGNISRNGQIYHAPWSPWYSRTKINIEKGERWFCDESEALAAGWRAPYWGK